jgi:outer membrane protein assembly factor BamB
MTIGNTIDTSPSTRQPLRLRPAVILAVGVGLGNYALSFIAPEVDVFSMPLTMIGTLGGMLCAVAIIVWWLFFSRAPWLDRLGAIVVMVLGVLATRLVVDESIRGAAMGLMLVFYSIPVLSIALVVWAAATRRFSSQARRASLVVAVMLACAPFTLLRTAGLKGGGSELHWRWTPTPEEILLAQPVDEPNPLSPAAAPTTQELPSEPLAAAAAEALVVKKIEPVAPAAIATPAEWPGFRGPDRDGVVRGVRINTDWSASPPVEMWRRPIGPGWSSFAVQGDLLYTQEQRGDDEIVACYRVSTGEPVWRHRDAVRFWESNGGAGPRGTPTLHKDRVYAFGATGILNALDARTGARVWSRNVSTDASRAVPDWGFSSSPLVVDDEVVVAASGTLAAYDLAAGKLRWVGQRQLASYSSPHRVTINGVPQILLLSGSGAASFAPADGAVLWQHEWQEGGATIVQPAMTPDGDLLVNGNAMSGSLGIRRITIGQAADTWSIAERWTSNGLKPYFNDFVVHNGHAYGFDGSILSCIDLADGARKWKGGRYGNGQLVLMRDQNALLIISEEGELALVGATPDQYKELARLPALNAKTWNHPVVVRDILLVRNGEEMAAFRLPLVQAHD